MSQVLDVLALQTLDDEAASLRAALTDVERRIASDPELDIAREGRAEAEARARDIHARQRALEDEVARLRAKIGPEEKRLYDGSVKNPKELTSIQHEVELLRAERSRVEDDLLEALGERESADAALTNARTRVAELEARRLRQVDELRAEAQRLNALIVRAEAKREAQKGRIPPAAVATYHEIRRKRGLAVVKIQGSSCLGCRITIPDALRRRAFAADSLVQCPNCERILYLG